MLSQPSHHTQAAHQAIPGLRGWARTATRRLRGSENGCSPRCCEITSDAEKMTADVSACRRGTRLRAVARQGLDPCPGWVCSAAAAQATRGAHAHRWGAELHALEKPGWRHFGQVSAAEVRCHPCTLYRVWRTLVRRGRLRSCAWYMRHQSSGHVASRPLPLAGPSTSLVCTGSTALLLARILRGAALRPRAFAQQVVLRAAGAPSL